MNTDKTSASICVHLRSKNPVPHAPVSFRADRKGQAQPLAAALATATTVFCSLTLIVLTGAVAVTCTVWFKVQG
jgi:hypothetical protein